MTIAELSAILTPLISGTAFADKTYIVGGAVRDHLLGKSDIADFDLTVELPRGGIRLANLLGNILRPDSTRINHHFGTARMDFPGYVLDLCGTRKERYRPNSRFPYVIYGSLWDDIMRRDFTINALLIEVGSFEVIDLCGQGLDDLKDGIIRTLRDPLIVLSEDPLRILRAVRFAVRLGFVICPELMEALKTSAPLVKTLSKSRKLQELKLMQEQPDFDRAEQMMELLGIRGELLRGEMGTFGTR
ncbi:MAG TPA: CCA tRNA nucleotidyltransferase [Candidatus Cloacimonadota bacterium]|nr:CCA tRNA nucleotidyltransferase [Candidatus Cloacimonadota bacterium]